MKERLLLLLCLTLTAGSASALRVLKSGTFPNGAGGWQINVYDDGKRELYIDAEVIPDYSQKKLSDHTDSKVTTAPWRNYTHVYDSSNAFTLKLSPRVKTIGEYAFSEVYVTNVEFEPRTEPVTIKEGAFYYSQYLETFDFSHVEYIGSNAFRSCGTLYSNKFPMLEECKSGAFSYCYALARGGEIVFGKNIPLSKLTGFIPLCSIRSGIGRMTFVWPITGYSTKPNTFGDYYIYNRVGGEGWSLDSQGGVFRLEDSFPNIDFATPEERPWHELRTEIKEVELSHEPRMNYFNGCTNLVEVRVSEDMENALHSDRTCLVNIGKRAFYGCSTLYSLKPTLGSYLMLPKIVGEEAFYDCKKLLSIDLSLCDRIEDRAFYGCSNLKGLEFFGHLKEIGSQAFADNTNLERILSTGEAPHTSENAFQGVTTSRVTLTIPANVANTYEKAPWNAFPFSKNYGWDENGNVSGTIGNLQWTLNKSGNMSVSGSGVIPDYDDITQQPWYNYRDYIKNIVIEEGIETIGKNAFAIPDGEISYVRNISISCRNIKEGAFRNQNNLQRVILQNVETLGSYAFAGCSFLNTIELGTSLSSVGDYVFTSCVRLRQIVNMTSTPATTTKYSFANINGYGGQSVVALIVPDGYVTKYLIDPNWSKFNNPYADDRGTWTKAGTFGDGMWILYDDGTMVIAADKGPEDVDATATELGFIGEPLVRTKKIEFSGNMTEFGSYFKEFTNLESVKLSPSIRKIPDNAFYYGTEGCTKLKEINLENVDTIGYNAFSGNAFDTIDLSNVKELGRYAFDNCPNLTTVMLGPVCNVGRYAFAHCPKLTTINLGSANVDNASNCFTGCTSLAEITFNGTHLPLDFFYNCKNLTTVNLGSRLESIEWSAFDGCTKLNTIYIDRATPPTLPKGEKQVWIGDVDYRMEDAWAFDGLTLSSINLTVPSEYVSAYRAANIWKSMTINGESGNVDAALPTGGTLGKYGTWFLDTDGTFIVDVSGDIPATDAQGKPWRETFNAWIGLIKKVIFTDNVTSIPDNFFGGTYFADASAGMESVTLGRFLKSVGENSLSFSGIKDVYAYSENLLELQSNTFNLDAAVKNNATLHILKTSDGYYYRYISATNRFPNIVADLDANGMMKCGTLGTQGYWTFADGVLTVTYNGAMPTITRSVTDPEKAFRYKWIDFLSEIDEIVITGKDVEVQPYLLYYEGDGDLGQHPDDHIKTVTLGEGVKKIGSGALSLYAMKRLNCYSVDAPVLASDASGGSSNKCFWHSRLEANMTFLWNVPNASTGYAMINSEWAKFNHSATKLNPLDMPTQENSADFETGKLNQIPFISEGEYPWDITGEDAESGSFCMKSGNKGIASSTSTISAMYLYETDGIIYFMAKCMGEGSGDGWDKCIFLIDGVQQFSYGALGNYWSNYSFPVSAGMHTFTWQYSKDSSVDPEGDGFFVDNIYFLQNGKDDDLITGVESPAPALSEGEDAWFDLSGRKLAGKPTKAGIYIKNGRKVMVK